MDGLISLLKTTRETSTIPSSNPNGAEDLETNIDLPGPNYQAYATSPSRFPLTGKKSFGILGVMSQPLDSIPSPGPTRSGSQDVDVSENAPSLVSRLFPTGYIVFLGFHGNGLYCVISFFSDRLKDIIN